jgi:hypothetical protein
MVECKVLGVAVRNLLIEEFRQKKFKLLADCD